MLAGAGSWLAMDAQGHFRGMGARGPGWGGSEGVRLSHPLSMSKDLGCTETPGPWAENEALLGQPANRIGETDVVFIHIKAKLRLKEGDPLEVTWR